jgi:hypothetical protein
MRAQALTLLLAALCAPALACMPEEAGGDGSKIRRAAEGAAGVLVWDCHTGLRWVGVRARADLALPREPGALRAHLARLDVMHGYDRLGMADLKPLVTRAR